MSGKYIIKSKNLIRKILKKIITADKMVNEYKRLSKTPAMPANAFMNAAGSMYMMGCFKEAEDLLRNAVCFPTKASNALINLGIIKQTIGDYKQAQKFYLAAYKKDKKNTKALSLWGNCLALTGKPEEAVTKYKHALKINQEDADVYLSWGALLIKQKEYKEAKEKLELALKYNTTDARPLYMLAIVEIEMCDFDSALDKLFLVINSTENNFEALHNIAYIYFRKKDYDNAILYAKQSLDIFKHKVETYLLLGDIYAIKNKEKEALQYYETAEKNNLKTFFLYMSWAVSLQKFNRHNEAIQKLHSANNCLSAKKVDEVYARLALSYLKTDQIELAVKNKDKALEINPENHMANSVAAEIEILNNNPASALKYLEKCENDFENKGYNSMLKAVCYSKLNDSENAEQLFEKALSYSPDNEEILVKYGTFLNDIQNYELTVKRLKSVCKKTKNGMLLNLYFIASYNLAKQNGYKYNIKNAVEAAEKAELLYGAVFPYKKEGDELRGLLQDYE